MTLPEHGSGPFGTDVAVSALDQPPTPTVAVIICAYTEERWTDLVAAVESVRSQTLPAAEVLVVIDHNEPLLRRARRLTGVTVVPSTGARGLSGARNTGVALASSAVVAFLDDDAAADPDWLAALAGAYSRRDVLGVGGQVQPVWPGRRPGFLPREFDWVVGCSYAGLPTETSAVRNMIGANMSFRREVFSAVGGFAAELGRIGSVPLGCEETELCIRARRHFPGATILYEPRARVRHRVSVDRARWRYFRSRCYAEGLSKAHVARLVGVDAGLATERTYVLRTLTRGIGSEVLRAVRHREPAGWSRAGAIVAGLAFTTAGYGRGALSARTVPPEARLAAAHRAQCA
jgi:GT2 family glycosyltransferase